MTSVPTVRTWQIVVRNMFFIRDTDCDVVTVSTAAAVAAMVSVRCACFVVAYNRKNIDRQVQRADKAPHGSVLLTQSGHTTRPTISLFGAGHFSAEINQRCIAYQTMLDVASECSKR